MGRECRTRPGKETRGLGNVVSGGRRCVGPAPRNLNMGRGEKPQPSQRTRKPGPPVGTGLSVNFDLTPEECRAQTCFDTTYGVHSLLVRSVRALELEVVPDEPHHANVTGIPHSDDDPKRAEFSLDPNMASGMLAVAHPNGLIRSSGCPVQALLGRGFVRRNEREPSVEFPAFLVAALSIVIRSRPLRQRR